MDVRRALEGLTECWRMLSVPEVGSLELDGIFAAGTGGSAPFCNQIIVLDEPSDLKKTLAAGIEFFDSRGLPFLAQTLSGSNAERALGGLGFRQIDSNPFMIMDPIVTTEPRADVTMVAVRTKADLEPLHAILTEAFGMPAPDVATFAFERFLERDDFYFFTGWVDGEPATTATAVRAGDIAGIFSVGTFQSFRRRGLGEAVTARAVEAAAAGGARAAFLQASGLGFPIYERMGFRTVAHHTMHARANV
jgi:N-acetylglutamate synthase